MNTPIPMIGRANISIFSFSHISATSHPVIVVPTLVPNMTQSEFMNVITHAFTNPIVISVVAVDDWRIAVARNPERNPLNRVLVHFSRICARVGPEAAFSPSDMRIIPRRKSHMPPRSVE